MKNFAASLASLLIASSQLTAARDTDTFQTQLLQSHLAVSLDEQAYTFSATFDALFLQPFANNLDYAAEATPFNYGINNPILSPSWTIPTISTDFHFGFDAALTTVFHSTASRLVLDWERYHTSTDSNTYSVADTNNMVGPFFEIGPDASLYKISKGTVNFHFDQVNLDYGTSVRFGNHLNTQMMAGIGFTRIVQNRYTRFSNVADTLIRTIKVPSIFLGFGPQASFDFNYSIYKGLQFVGSSRTSLFVGSLRNSTTFSTSSGPIVALGDTNPNIQHTTPEKKMGLVPGFEGSLGLAYEALFSDHYELKLEAGYRAQVYINAIRSIDMGSQVALGAAGSIGSQDTGVYARTFERLVSDFSMAGPYVSLMFGF